MPPKTIDPTDKPAVQMKTNRAILELVTQLYLPNGDMLARHFDTGEFDELKLETREDRLYILGYVKGELQGEFELKNVNGRIEMKVNTPISIRRSTLTISNQV